jgi:2-amino-4-hydroxy-6-hydroxymethyldihydropteridine diphosphokinase
MSCVSRIATAAADGALVYLGLGANLAGRAAQLRRAIAGLSRLLDVEAQSTVYETEPFGITDQPRFLNMVVRGRTLLEPLELLHAVKRLEHEMGRVPTVRMGPRIIDIDILLYDDRVLDADGLTLPHPGLTGRAFVLRPLLELDPALRHPGTDAELRAALDALGADDAGVQRLGALDTITDIE